MKNDIFLLHGFNVRDGGKGTVGKLIPHLPNSKILPYGWIGVLGVTFFNDNIAKMLVNQITDDCTIIGHSNAADVIYRMTQLDNCPRIARIVLIRPALDSDVSFGDKVGRIDVFYHQGDVPVSFAKYIPCHNWGSMGTEGYDGPDKNVVGHNSEELFNDSAHSAVFNEKLTVFVPYLKEILL